MKKLNLTKVNNEKSKLREHEMDKIRAGGLSAPEDDSCGCSGWEGWYMTWYNLYG